MRVVSLRSFSSQGVHYIHIPHPDAGDNVRLPFEELVVGHDDYIGVGNVPETEGRAIVVNPTGDNLPSDELSSWLSDKLHQRNAPVSMAAEHPINMEDPRIREWTQEELDPVYNWLHMGQAHYFLKSITKVRSWLQTLVSHTLSSHLEYELGREPNYLNKARVPWRVKIDGRTVRGVAQG